MRAPFAIVRAARACASTALVLLACSDEAGDTGGDDAATGGKAGAGGANGGASGSTGIGGGKGGGSGGGAGTTAAGAGMGGTSGASGDAGAGMGGEGGMDDGGEGGEGAIAGSGAGMAGSSMGGNAMGGAGASGGMSGAGGAGNGGAGNGGAGVGGSSGGSVGGTGVGGGGAGGAGAGGGGKGGAGAGGGGKGGAGAGGAGAGGAGAGGGGKGGAGAGGGGTGGSAGTSMITWDTRVLATDHVAEGADVGDIDGDGAIDLVAGPRWYKGPGFALGGTLMANPPTPSRDNYSTFFLTFVDDLNGDNRPDVIAVGDAGGGNGSGNPNTSWYQNPGPNFGQAWTKTGLYTAGSGHVANESPAYVDLLGDGRRELVFMTGGRLGYGTRGATPTTGWTFTAVTPSGNPNFAEYTHGLGVGDIDGDGLRDLVERTGWWRQVAVGNWERRAYGFGMAPPTNWGGAQMPVYDVDGDGDNDVVSARAAHGYGISWYERTGSGASISFTAHTILSTTPTATNNFSQPHAMVAADVNGDGLTDIIAGKRYYAHPTGNLDPGSNDPVVLYWFELRRSGGTATFIPHLVHSASGAGCNFVARDLTGDGKVDIFTTNKFGTYLHVQR